MKDKIIFSETLSGLTPKKLEGFFVGWPKKPSSKTLLTLLRKSDYRIIARNSNGRVVGFITAISDSTLAAKRTKKSPFRRGSFMAGRSG